VPHLGQGSPATPGGGTGPVAVPGTPIAGDELDGPGLPGIAPVPPGDEPKPAGEADSGVRVVGGGPAMRIPQTSQKSSLAESCPLGHTAIAAS